MRSCTNVQMKSCSNDKLSHGSSNEKLLKWEIVQMKSCTNEKAFKWKDVQIIMCSNEKLFVREVVQMISC